MIPDLLNFYRTTVVPALLKECGYTNVHQVLRIEKVVVNSCVGGHADGKQAVEDVKSELSVITGQKAAETRSKKSIANFKLRKGQLVGARVTLRGARMFEFLDRLIRMSLPRIRDFRGVSPKAFDGNGNYTFGITDQSIFPEIELDKVKRSIGFDITVVTSAGSDDEAKALLSHLGVPFSDRQRR